MNLENELNMAASFMLAAGVILAGIWGVTGVLYALGRVIKNISGA